MRRHPFDPVSAIFGTIFLAAGIIGLTKARFLSLLQGGRLWGVLLLIGGVAVLVAALRRTGTGNQASFAGTPPPVARSTQPEGPSPVTDVELAIQELAAERRAARDSSPGDRSAPDPPRQPADSQDEVNLEEPPSDDHV